MLVEPLPLPTTYHLVYYAAIGRGGECMLGVTCWLKVLSSGHIDMEGYHFIMRVVSFTEC